MLSLFRNRTFCSSRLMTQNSLLQKSQKSKIQSLQRGLITDAFLVPAASTLTAKCFHDEKNQALAFRIAMITGTTLSIMSFWDYTLSALEEEDEDKRRELLENALWKPHSLSIANQAKSWISCKFADACEK